MVLIPAFKYRRNTSPIRLLNTLIFNSVCWLKVSIMQSATIFVSGPTMGLFLFPVIRRDHSYFAELRDCWPLIAYQRNASPFARIRFNCLSSLSRIAYRRISQHCRIRCVSAGVFNYLSPIVTVDRLLYRPFVAEVGAHDVSPSSGKRSGAIFAGNFEKDLICQPLNICFAM